MALITLHEFTTSGCVERVIDTADLDDASLGMLGVGGTPEAIDEINKRYPDPD